MDREIRITESHNFICCVASHNQCFLSKERRSKIHPVSADISAGHGLQSLGRNFEEELTPRTYKFLQCISISELFTLQHAYR